MSRIKIYAAIYFFISGLRKAEQSRLSVTSKKILVVIYKIYLALRLNRIENFTPTNRVELCRENSTEITYNIGTQNNYEVHAMFYAFCFGLCIVCQFLIQKQKFVKLNLNLDSEGQRIPFSF